MEFYYLGEVLNFRKVCLLKYVEETWIKEETDDVFRFIF